MQDLICAHRCDGVLQMAIPSAEVSLIFERGRVWAIAIDFLQGAGGLV